MSTNISKKKREDLLDKIKQIRAFIAAAPQDENTGNLLSYLSELEKDVNGKKYGLVFEEHREEIDEVLDTHTPVLTEEADLFIDHGGQMNFLLEGDNLAALKLLEKTHRGILPSEKAFAYKMKRDALNHQGMTSPQVGEKLLTAEKIGLDGGDSRNQVLRYIRLTYLIPELLSMVDNGKIAFNPAVELSYLDSYQQRAVLDAMVLNDCTPSHAQSIRLKKLAQEGLLDDQIVYAVLAETKPNQQEQLKFKREELRKYFPSGYTEEQMRRDIIKGLELLKRQRERNRDAR